MKESPLSRPHRATAWTAGIISLGFVALAQFIAHARRDELDGWLFACYGRELLRGARLYADLWDIKPPLIFWLNAAGLRVSGGHLAGIWALCAAASVASVFAFYLGANRLFGRSAALIGTALAALYLNLHHFHVGGNRPATFFVLTELACFAWYLRGSADRANRGEGGAIFAAGLCAGLSFCVKQTALAVAAAIVVHTLYLACCGSLSRRDAWRRLILVGVGAATAVAFVVAALLATSDLRWAWDAIFGFLISGLKGRSEAFTPPVGWLGECAKPLALPLILAGATLVNAALRWGKPDTEDSPGRAGLMVLLWAWLIAAVVLALVGLRERGWYLAAALPPLLMLSACSVHLLLRSARREGDCLPAYYVVVGGLWLAYMMSGPLGMQLDMAARQYHHAFEAPAHERTERLVAAIGEYSRADERIFFFGYQPDLLWRCDRRPGTRYPGTIHAGAWGDPNNPHMDRVARAVREAQPRIIVYLPQPAAHPVAQAFAEWLHSAYVRPDVEGLPSLWVRVD